MFGFAAGAAGSDAFEALTSANSRAARKLKRGDFIIFSRKAHLRGTSLVAAEFSAADLGACMPGFAAGLRRGVCALVMVAAYGTLP